MDLKPLSVFDHDSGLVRHSNGLSALQNRSEQMALHAYKNRTGNLYTYGPIV